MSARSTRSNQPSGIFFCFFWPASQHNQGERKCFQMCIITSFIIRCLSGWTTRKDVVVYAEYEKKVSASVRFWPPDSLWSPAGTSKSSLHGATSTGTWPTRASSIWGISCTCPLRLYLPLYAVRPAPKQPGPAPRVKTSRFINRGACVALFCVSIMNTLTKD